MKRIHVLGTALLAAACMVTAPAIGAGKKSTSESKSAESAKSRSEKKAKSKASKEKAPEAKSAPQVKRDSDPKPPARVESKVEAKPTPKKVEAKPKQEATSKDAGRRDAEAAKERSSRTLREAPVSQRDLNQQGNLGNASSGNPADASDKAAELRSGRKAPGSASAPATSLRDPSDSSPPKQTRPPIETGAPGSVTSPVADPLAKAAGVGSPTPTADELQASSRAAKGDRTSQASTRVRVNENLPDSVQGGGILVKEGDIYKIVDTDPEAAESNRSLEESRRDAADDEREAEETQRAEEEAETERAEADAREERAEEEAREQSAQDKADQDAEEEDEKRKAEEGTTTPTDKAKADDYRPNEANATEYITQMTDAEIAARKAETKAGLVNPTGAGGGREVVDPNSAREIGRSASPRAGWAIDPGTGEAAGAAPTTGGVPERPDECDLAGGAAGDCGAGDGLR